MRIKIYCNTHKQCPVIPAGEALRWLPVEKEGDERWTVHNWTGTFELDEADLYCTSGDVDPPHQFIVAIELAYEVVPSRADIELLRTDEFEIDFHKAVMKRERGE